MAQISACAYGGPNSLRIRLDFAEISKETKKRYVNYLLLEHFWPRIGTQLQKSPFPNKLIFGVDSSPEDCRHEETIDIS